MGIFTGLRALADQRAINAALSIPQDPSTFPIASPWAPSSDLNRIVAEDIFGQDLPVNTRSAAMRIPAISRGRNLIVSTIAGIPLAAATAAGPAVTPQWMSNSVDGTSPQHRLAWTIDDLIFYGWSCWWRENYAASDGGFPRAVSRVNQGEWSVDDGHVLVRGTEAKPNEVILIPGFHEGILTFGVDTLADARDLYAIVRQRLRTPAPQLNLHQVSGTGLTDDEIDKLIDRWATARIGGKGGVSFTSEHVEVQELGANEGQLLIEARNAASLDLARVIGVTAGLIDATAPKASLNYETTTGRNQEFVDRDLRLYMEPIRARLSLDDVMPHGQRATWDLTDFTAPAPTPTGPVLED